MYIHSIYIYTVFIYIYTYLFINPHINNIYIYIHNRMFHDYYILLQCGAPQ